MKIAVLNSNGVQLEVDGQKGFYYLVDDAYNFTTNRIFSFYHFHFFGIINRYNEFRVKIRDNGNYNC